jgi:FlaA1/EpsC-like NDP-sugar epimerase
VREAAELCEQAHVTLKVLPSVKEIFGDKVSARDIRDLRIEDLLGRKQVETDLEAVAAMLRGRQVLVTGAGGSIGSEIARQVASFGPAALILLDHDKTHLHDVVMLLDELHAVAQREAGADPVEEPRVETVACREAAPCCAPYASATCWAHMKALAAASMRHLPSQGHDSATIAP